MLKVDIKHPEFKQIVLASPGIGNGYFDRLDWQWQKQNYERLEVPTYTFRNGTKMAMPKYYKDKLFTEKERNKMWINNLNRGILWIYGEKVKANDWKTIDNLRKYWQNFGRTIMGDDPIAWDKAKTRRAEEKQRKAIAEARRKTEKFSTQTLTIELPLQAEFAMQEKEFEIGYIRMKSYETFMLKHRQLIGCKTTEQLEILGVNADL